MRILCIADVHGHADALEKVLDVGLRAGCKTVVVAGDLCFPGPEPLRVWKLLMSAHAQCVQGVSDRALTRLDPRTLRPSNRAERLALRRMEACRAELGEVILTRLARLPTTLRMCTEDGGELMVVHGAPTDPMTEITHDLDDQEMLALLGEEPPQVVLCGASHVPFERSVGGSRVIGLGSVGEAPTENVAHATVLETSETGTHATMMSLVVRPRGGA